MEVRIIGGVEITRKMRHRMMSNAAWELLEQLLLWRQRKMYIHEEILQAVLPLIKKYDLELIDLIGELNHAAFTLYPLNPSGIEKLIAQLDDKLLAELAVK